VLSERSDQIAGLVNDTNALLTQLQSQSASLDQMSSSLSAFAKQLAGLSATTRVNFTPRWTSSTACWLSSMPEKHGCSCDQVPQPIRAVIGETVASGPFFKAYVAKSASRAVPATVHRTLRSPISA